MDPSYCNFRRDSYFHISAVSKVWCVYKLGLTESLIFFDKVTIDSKQILVVVNLQLILNVVGDIH